ncbi:MAG: hypothetical protein ACRDQZ_15005 [Mycobacteriales bacterium]
MDVPPQQYLVSPKGEERAHREVGKFLGEEPGQFRFWLTSQTGNRIELPANLARTLAEIAHTLGDEDVLSLETLPFRFTLGHVAQLAMIRVEDVERYITEGGYTTVPRPDGPRLQPRDAIEIIHKVDQFREQGLQDMVTDAENLGLYYIPDEELIAAAREARKELRSRSQSHENPPDNH